MRSEVDLLNDYLKKNSTAKLYCFTNPSEEVKYKDKYYDKLLFAIDRNKNMIYSAIDNESYKLDLFLAELYQSQDKYGINKINPNQGTDEYGYNDEVLPHSDELILVYNIAMFTTNLNVDLDIDGYRLNKYIITDDNKERVAM